MRKGVFPLLAKPGKGGRCVLFLGVLQTTRILVVTVKILPTPWRLYNSSCFLPQNERLVLCFNNV